MVLITLLHGPLLHINISKHILVLDTYQLGQSQRQSTGSFLFRLFGRKGNVVFVTPINPTANNSSILNTHDRGGLHEEFQFHDNVEQSNEEK
jgi:hypothetical protein